MTYLEMFKSEKWINIMAFRNKSQHINDKGQNLVELAIILPVLFFILFGVLDLGRIYFATIALTNAAREGVRYLTTHPDDAYSGFSDTKSVARDEANYSGIPKTSVVVTASCQFIDGEGHCETGRELDESPNKAEVTVTYDFDLILGWIIPSPITITRSAKMVVP